MLVAQKISATACRDGPEMPALTNATLGSLDKTVHKFANVSMAHIVITWLVRRENDRRGKWHRICICFQGLAFVLLELTARIVLSVASAKMTQNAIQKQANVSASQDGMASSANDLVRFTLMVKAARRPANAWTMVAVIQFPVTCLVHPVGRALIVMKENVPKTNMAKIAENLANVSETTPSFVIRTMESAFVNPVTTRKTVLLVTKSSKVKVASKIS